MYLTLSTYLIITGAGFTGTTIDLTVADFGVCIVLLCLIVAGRATLRAQPVFLDGVEVCFFRGTAVMGLETPTEVESDLGIHLR